MGGAKQPYQEYMDFLAISAAMTETSEDLTKTMELLERNLEIVELKNHTRALKTQLLECHDLIREH